MSQNITCTLYIVDFKRNIPIYFKRDGKRFDMPTTLKLLAFSQYRFHLRIRPILSQVSSIQINGVSTNFVVGSSDKECVTINFVWDSNGVNPSDNKTRSEFAIEVTFDSGSTLKLELQVKFYRKPNSHLMWGVPLNYLSFQAQQRSNEIHYQVFCSEFY